MTYIFYLCFFSWFGSFSLFLLFGFFGVFVCLFCLFGAFFLWTFILYFPWDPLDAFAMAGFDVLQQSQIHCCIYFCCETDYSSICFWENELVFGKVIGICAIKKLHKAFQNYSWSVSCKVLSISCCLSFSYTRRTQTLNLDYRSGFVTVFPTLH